MTSNPLSCCSFTSLAQEHFLAEGAHAPAELISMEAIDEYDSDDSQLKEKEMDGIVEDIEKENVGEQAPVTKWSKARDAIRDWGESSSCHGIPHMAQASTFIAAVVWSIILAFCAVGFVYLFSDTLAQYLRFEKIVQLNVSNFTLQMTPPLIR
ncbi:unnamed protein product [Haemonchus placei]|uniref:Uncharacterized protein n=1 Tax=Haemonchus placei TaxID=6290 RepID=A0A0N4W310_HAEPC|nr:unnamed protein product [Haemonchus placei]